MNSSAVPPFTRMPAAATHITAVAPTGAGLAKRPSASTAMAPHPSRRMTALASAARMLLRPQP